MAKFWLLLVLNWLTISWLIDHANRIGGLKWAFVIGGAVMAINQIAVFALAARREAHDGTDTE